MLHGMEPIMCYHVFIASFCKIYQCHVQKQFDEYDERITKHNEQMRARHNEAELEKWRKYEKNLQEWRDYVAQVEEGRAPDYDLEKAYDILSNEEPMPDSVSKISFELSSS